MLKYIIYGLDEEGIKMRELMSSTKTQKTRNVVLHGNVSTEKGKSVRSLLIKRIMKSVYIESLL